MPFVRRIHRWLVNSPHGKVENVSIWWGHHDAGGDGEEPEASTCAKMRLGWECRAIRGNKRIICQTKFTRFLCYVWCVWLCVWFYLLHGRPPMRFGQKTIIFRYLTNKARGKSCKDIQSSETKCHCTEEYKHISRQRNYWKGLLFNVSGAIPLWHANFTTTASKEYTLRQMQQQTK